MSQVFHPASNSIAKSLIVVVVLGVVGLTVLVSIFVRSPFMRQVGVAPEQPVAFSHEHHVGGLGLDCRYCHLNVEESGFAGIPATDICMGCHSKIWTDSTALAPVVASYENDEPLVWNYVRPREEVFTMGWEPSEDWEAQQPLLVEKYHVDVEQFEITDCSICHR